MGGRSLWSLLVAVGLWWSLVRSLHSLLGFGAAAATCISSIHGTATLKNNHQAKRPPKAPKQQRSKPLRQHQRPKKTDIFRQK